VFKKFSSFGVLAAILLGSTSLFGLGASQAYAGEILKSTAARETAAAEKRLKADKSINRRRLVDIDLGEINRQILPAGADKASDRAKSSAGLRGEVSLQLFADVKIDLKRSRVEDAVGGGVVWSAETPGGYGILVVNGGHVTGSIEANGHTYVIEPAGNGSLHRVRDVNTEAFANDVHLDIAKAGKGGGKGGGGGGGGSTTPPPPPPPPPTGTVLEVNLLGAYTTRAFNLLGGVPADRIALDVAIVNQGYVNSGVPLHMNLVGVTAVSSSYDEKTYADYAQPLYDLTSGTIYNFATIRGLRDSLAADMVTMYADRPEYCGIAWVGVSASYAFSAINPACSGTATLAHELGHNMGLHHDRYVEPATGSDVYSYGYVSTQAKVRDIMSYTNQCTALGFSCPRVTYFSNPNIIYNGYPLGIPQGTAGAADASRKLGENASAVSTFR
jgi:hypothetical protein